MKEKLSLFAIFVQNILAMTEDQKHALRETLYNKSVRELVEMLIAMQEEVEEAKQIRRRFTQIKNLLKDPEERRRPGRPRIEK